MNLWQTLLHPDREERGERGEVAEAANHLQVGEFQLLQLAYHEWYGSDMPEGLSHRLFTAYMLHDQVPHWARHYARRVLEAACTGELNDVHPHFHRYDDEYVSNLPRGVKRFIAAATLIFGVLGGSLLLSHYVAKPVTSVLPPYFENQEIDRSAMRDDLRGS